MNEYAQRELNETKEFLKELNNFGIKFELKENKTEPERSQVVLVGDVPIIANKKNYRGTFGFWLDYKGLKYIDYHKYNKVAEASNKPQGVGVLTKKKIQDWIDFLSTVYAEIVKLSAETVKEVEKFRAEVKNAGAVFYKSQDEYNLRHGIFSGYISKNGLRYGFEVGDEGYISREIKFDF